MGNDCGPGFAHKAEATLRSRGWPPPQRQNGHTRIHAANGSDGDHVARLVEVNLVVPVFRDPGLGATAALVGPPVAVSGSVAGVLRLRGTFRGTSGRTEEWPLSF